MSAPDSGVTTKLKMTRDTYLPLTTSQLGSTTLSSLRNTKPRSTSSTLSCCKVPYVALKDKIDEVFDFQSIHM